MTKIRKHGFLYRWVAIIGVSAYLVVVYWYLRIRGQVRPQSSFLKLLGQRFRRPYSGALLNVSSDTGHCFTAPVPASVLSDMEGMSRLRVFEDGFPLAQTGADHDMIRRVGKGAFSHWGPFVYFSTSDNTDPRTNGRQYAVKEC
jgi:hypothetical protein